MSKPETASDASPEIAPTSIVLPGTVLGKGCKVLDGAVVGKEPSLSPRSSTKREQLPPTEIGAGAIISTGAIVFAGTKIGARVIVGDQACVRERVEIGEDVVLGRGVQTTNDNFMGRTEKRHALMKGPTIRRRARVGGAAVLLPGIEIGEEA